MNLTHAETQPAPLLRIKTETLLIALVIGLAALARLAALDTAPLNDAEAGNAFAAWHLADPARAFAEGIVRSPLATLLASAFFSLTGGTSNEAARLFPALASVGLLTFPLLLRRWIGGPQALIAFLFMAGSAFGLVSGLSLQGVGAALLALCLGLWCSLRALESGSRQDWALAAIALALALLSEAAAYLGLLAMALGLLYATATDDESGFRETLIEALRSLPGPTLALAFALSFLLVGTGFFFAPGMLGEAARLFSTFITGWIEPAGGAYLGFLLLIYEPYLLIFGLLGIWQSVTHSDPLRRFIAGWALAALTLCLLYRGAPPVYGLLILPPFALMAASALISIFSAEDDESPALVMGLAVAVLALLAMAFSALTMYLRLPQILPLTLLGRSFELPLDLFRALTWMLVLVAGAGMAVFTWGRTASAKGLAVAALLLALLHALSSYGALGFSARSNPYEIIHQAPARVQLNLMAATVGEVADFSTGDERTGAITVQGSSTGALAWVLRDQENVRFVDELAADVATPVVLITSPALSPFPPDDVQPALGANYVGQDFMVTARWQPNALNTKQWLQWLIYRESISLPYGEWVVLWVRDDIYTLNTGE